MALGDRDSIQPCKCGHEKGDHQFRIGQRGNYTPCNHRHCPCSGFRALRRTSFIAKPKGEKNHVA